MTKEEFALEIDKAWDDYYNFHHELFSGPGNGCDDYRDLDEVDGSYLTNLRKKAENMEEGFFNIYGIKYREYKDNNKKKMTPAEFIKYAAENHIKFDIPEDNRKYPGQQCQDDKLNGAFRRLHTKLVTDIILFCKAWNISIDEFHLNADGVSGSIQYGGWESCTDSSFSFTKYSDDYIKAYCECDKEFLKGKTKQDLDKIDLEQEPYLISL